MFMKFLRPNWVASLLAIAMFAFPAWAAEFASDPGSSGNLTPGTSTNFRISTALSVNDFSRAIPACRTMRFVWDRSSTATVSLYPTQLNDLTLSAITANTSLTQLTVDGTYTGYPTTPFVRVVVNVAETSSTPSMLYVYCYNTADGQTIQQNNPSSYIDVPGTQGVAHSPAAVTFGHGIEFEGAPGAFTAKNYPGSATAGSELDNTMGWFYNKGVNASAPTNKFEHAWDASWELSYRSTGGTSDQTWVEWNWDFFPPDNTFLLSGSSGTWVASDVVAFTNGGSCRVMSSSGSDPNKSVVCRADFGTVAVGETMTNITRAGSGTVVSVTRTGTVNYRPFLFAYRTLDNTASFDFETSPGNGTVSISSGFLRHHSRIVPGSVSGGTQALGTSLIGAGACDSATTTAVSGTVSTDIIRWSYNASPGTDGRLVVNPVPSANTVTWVVCNPTAAGITPAARTVNWIVDRYL